MLCGGSVIMSKWRWERGGRVQQPCKSQSFCCVCVEICVEMTGFYCSFSGVSLGMKAQLSFRRSRAARSSVVQVQGVWVWGGRGEDVVSTCWNRKRAEWGSRRRGSRSRGTLAGEPPEQERQATSAAGQTLSAEAPSPPLRFSSGCRPPPVCPPEGNKKRGDQTLIAHTRCNFKNVHTL